MYVVCGASVTDGGRKGVGRSGCLGGGVMGLGGPWACTSLSLSLSSVSLFSISLSIHPSSQVTFRLAKDRVPGLDCIL